MTMNDWSFNAVDANEYVAENNGGKDDLFVFIIGRDDMFRGKRGDKLVDTIQDVMRDNRSGLLSLKPGKEEVYSVVLKNWEPATGPCVAIRGSVFRSVGKFSDKFISYKHAIADLSHRANMQSMNISKLFYPGVHFKDVPSDIWFEKDKEVYNNDWKMVVTHE